MERLDIVIGLGANLGDPLTTLRRAVDRVASVTTVLARSRVWESSPIGGPSQPDFFNAAILVAWSRAPIELLDALMEIEADLGRVRDVRNGPRMIDLDLLWISGHVIEHPRLVVPHPRLHERAFALAPLLEVVPGAIDPRTGQRYVVPSGQGIRGLDVSV